MVELFRLCVNFVTSPHRLFTSDLCNLRGAEMPNCLYCNNVTELQVILSFCVQGVNPQRHIRPGINTAAFPADIFENFVLPKKG